MPVRAGIGATGQDKTGQDRAWSNLRRKEWKAGRHPPMQKGWNLELGTWRWSLMRMVYVSYHDPANVFTHTEAYVMLVY